MKLVVTKAVAKVLSDPKAIPVKVAAALMDDLEYELDPAADTMTVLVVSIRKDAYQ